MDRIVLDTDVVISAMRSPSGASAAILNEALQHRVQLLTSVPLILEYEAKCTLAEHYQAAEISRLDALNFVDVMTVLSEHVKQHYYWRPQTQDPDDEMVLETAMNGSADAIVTFNVRDYGVRPSQFGIEVVRPADAIWRIRS